MSSPVHPAAIANLPVFITAPGQTDVLFNVVVASLLAIIVLVGVFYFILHSVPERIAHHAGRAQLQIVAVLALLALFTHETLYWVAALLLAFIRFPDFETPLRNMDESLRQLAGRPAPQAAAEDTAKQLEMKV